MALWTWRSGKWVSPIFYRAMLCVCKDSLALFNCKLAQLPSMFGLKGVEKELFPYNYYTYSRLAENEIVIDENESVYIGRIDEAGKYENTPWGSEEYTQFKINC